MFLFYLFFEVSSLTDVLRVAFDQLVNCIQYGVCMNVCVYINREVLEYCIKHHLNRVLFN